MTRRSAFFLAALLTAMAADNAAPGNGKLLGNPGAPLRLEVFSDFT